MNMKNYIRSDMSELKPDWYDGWIAYIESTNRLAYEDKTYRAGEWPMLRKSIKSYVEFRRQRHHTNDVIRYKDMENQIAYMELAKRNPMIAEMRFNTSQTGIKDEYAAPKIKLIHGKNGKRYSICRIHRSRGGFTTVQPNGNRRVVHYKWDDVADIKWVDLPVDEKLGRTYASKRMVIVIQQNEID